MAYTTPMAPNPTFTLAISNPCNNVLQAGLLIEILINRRQAKPQSRPGLHAKTGPGFMYKLPRFMEKWARAACKTGPGFMQHGSGLQAKPVQASCKTDPGIHARPRIHAHPGPASCKTCPGIMENRPRLHAQPVLASYNTGHGQLRTRPASCTTGLGFIQHRARPTREASRNVVSPRHSASRVYRALHSVARDIKVASGFF